MDFLEEVFDDKDRFKLYKSNYLTCMDLLSKCKSLFDIKNIMELDISMGKIHNAKVYIDSCLKIIELIMARKLNEYNRVKEFIKIEKLNIEMKYYSANSDLKDDIGIKEWEKRRLVRVNKDLKKSQDRMMDLSTEMELLKYEIKQIERSRENIDDNYLSLKKKYDWMIRHTPVTTR